MSMYNKSKFSLSEIFNNSNGKTSGSAFAGILMAVTCVGAFISGIVGWFSCTPLIIEYFDKVLQLGGLAALLLGVRKASSIFTKKEEAEPEKKEEVKPIEKG